MQTRQRTDKNVYKQSLASLRLEGLDLTLSQQKIVRSYQTGKITKAEFLAQAATNARSR